MENACLFHLQHLSDLSLIVLFISFFFFSESRFPPPASPLDDRKCCQSSQSAPGLIGRLRLTTSSISIPGLFLSSERCRDRCPHPYKYLYCIRVLLPASENLSLCGCVRHLPPPRLPPMVPDHKPQARCSAVWNTSMNFECVVHKAHWQ